MLKFKKIEISDIEIYREFLKNNKEFSCENSFVNLLVWQCAYNNMMALFDGQLFIKSGPDNKQSFRLPIGGDLNKGIKIIEEYSGENAPSFWIQEGENYSLLDNYFKEKYEFNQNRNASDYIYLTENLANLSGKKYHSKRNHINSFNKKFVWRYEEINENNIEKVKLCAQKWYAENIDKRDSYLLCEKSGVETILNNMELLKVKGGAIIIEDSVVAFTLGSSINNDVFDIHIEKALKDYAEAYTVINNEFAKRLIDYKYLNREDDMGLEGLRKAKLSYKPEIILNKYYCKPKEKGNG